MQLWRPSLQHTSFVGMVQGEVKWGIWDLNSNAHLPVFQGSRVIWGICYAESIWNQTAEGEESLQWCFFLLCCVLKTTTTTTAKTSFYHNNSNKAAVDQPLVSKLCLLCRGCAPSGQGSGKMLKVGICGCTEHRIGVKARMTLNIMIYIIVTWHLHSITSHILTVFSRCYLLLSRLSRCQVSILRGS